MGRGLGPHQKLVLRLLEEDDDRYETELIWRVAEEGGHVQPSVAGALPPRASIPPKVYHGVRRGISALVKRKLVTVRSRRLSSLDELARLYPYRTKDARERFCRELLLPPLLDYARSEAPQYQRADNEVHVMSEIAVVERDRLREIWRAQDRTLALLEPLLPDTRRRNIFALRVRGAELFESSGVHHDRAFDYLLRKALDESELDAEKRALDALRLFYATDFPRHDVERATMKSLLHSAVDTRSGQRGGLKPRAAWHLVDHLVANAPQVAHSLGWKPRTPRARRGMQSLEDFLDQRKGPALGRLGDRLLDRDAFAKFRFVRRAESSIP